MKTQDYIIIGAVWLLINIAAYASMGIDKKRAIKKQYRISEKTLFTLALLGGSLGSIIGMQHFRHKTKHWYFKYGMPLIFIVQIIFLDWYVWTIVF